MAWNATNREGIVHLQLEGNLDGPALTELQSENPPQADVVFDITHAAELIEWEELIAVQADWMAHGFSAVVLATEEQLTVFDGLELPMAPTWQECLDLIEMERIERQLGM